MEKTLVITTTWWTFVGQLATALANVGFRVATISPPGHVVRKIRIAEFHYNYRHWAGRQSVVQAIRAWSPDFIICADDRAVCILHDLHSRAALAVNDPDGDRLRMLIERSLGDPAGFAIARAKSKLMALAHSLGLRCPRTTIVSDERVLKETLVKGVYPAVLKADGGWGGSGVRIVDDLQNAIPAFYQLVTPPWKTAIAQSVDEFMPQPFLEHVMRRRRIVCVQEYIAGRPASRAVVCWKGKVLAGISVEALEVKGENGPATVFRIVDHPEMNAAAELLASRLSINGFCGFDFVLDEAGRAWLIEMNPRATPICHIPFAGGTDLPAAMISQLGGTRPLSRSQRVKNGVVALFPQEWQRNRCSEYFQSAYHDVQWDEPEFVAACLARWAGYSPMRIMRERLKDWRNPSRRTLRKFSSNHRSPGKISDLSNNLNQNPIKNLNR